MVIHQCPHHDIGKHLAHLEILLQKLVRHLKASSLPTLPLGIELVNSLNWIHTENSILAYMHFGVL